MRSAEPLRTTPKTILLVDDEKEFLLSLADALETLDGSFTVILAQHGREALEIINGLEVDLMVTDIKMPKIDGLELLEKVAELVPNLPKMVMTSLGSPEIEARAREIGISAYFEKPIDLEELLAAIHTIISIETPQGERP